MPVVLLGGISAAIASASMLASQAHELTVDPDHTTVGFSAPILHGLSAVRGKFTDFKIEIQFDEANMSNSSVRAVIKAASVSTEIAQRDRHLRTKDFFDVERFPDITFVSESVAKQGDHFVATGLFTLHGVSKRITLPFLYKGVLDASKYGWKFYGFECHTKINRKDYGMNWMHPNSVPEWVGDVIDIDINVLALVEASKGKGETSDMSRDQALRELRQVYDTYTSAYVKGDYETTSKFIDDPFSCDLGNGRKLDRAAFLGMLKRRVGSHYDSFSVKIEKLDRVGSDWVAVIVEDFKVKRLNKEGKSQTLRQVSKTRDVWRKKDGHWVASASDILVNEFEVDGKRVDPVKKSGG